MQKDIILNQKRQSYKVYTIMEMASLPRPPYKFWAKSVRIFSNAHRPSEAESEGGF